MQAEINKLLTFILADDQKALNNQKASDHEAAFNMLSAYIEAELDGGDAATLFPDVRAALEAHPLLRELYEDARVLLRREREEALREPATEPNFDFSYLAQITPSSSTDIWHTVKRKGREVKELFCQLRLVFAPGKAFFDQLPPPLRVEWQSLPMPSRTQVVEQPIPVLSLPSVEHDLLLGIELEQSQDESEDRDMTLTINVRRLSSKQAVSGSRIILRDANYRMLESHFTEEKGRVSFANLLADSYVVDIKHQGRILQVPIHVGRL